MKSSIIMLAVAVLVSSVWATGATVAGPAAEPRPAVDQQSPTGKLKSEDAVTIPQMLSYQGKLTDTLGVPVADTLHAIRFRLYAQPTGGTQFWEENQNVRTKGGLFSTLLGSVTPISSVPDAGALYLGMAVAGGNEMTPRLRIASAAYAYLTARAADADLLQGKDTAALDGRYVNEAQANSVTSAMITNGTIAAADLGQMGASSGQVMKWTGSAWAPRNDSVGSGGGSGTVRKVVQAAGVVCSPNPITDSGTVRLDTTYGDGRYLRNQFGANQAASWRVTGRGSCSTAVDGAALSATNTYASGGGIGVLGLGSVAIGVYGGSGSTYGVYGTTEASDYAGVYGHSIYGRGVHGNSIYSAGVHGTSINNNGVHGASDNVDGVYGASAASNFAGVSGHSIITGTGHGIGTYGYSPTYWGVMGYRHESQDGSDYSMSGARGGLWGYTFWGDTWTFGTAGYTYGDDARTGGVIGADASAANWGSLGYKNSSGTWYAGYGTAGWTSGSGLSRDAATGIGCGYGGGLMGGWLKGKCYGATVSGDRYALYTKGNNYTTGYSAVMQNIEGRREASYVPTSTTVDVYASGVAELDGGKATVSFPASFSSIVSKEVPVVVTATPMGPASIYLSFSDNKGFVAEAVDSKASVKFSWIAVGRRAGYEKNPEVPAELCRTDFDEKMDGVMFNENDLKHSAQPVWFDGTQLRFDTPPQELRPPKPAQPGDVGLHAPSPELAPVVPADLQAPMPAGSKPVPVSGAEE